MFQKPTFGSTNTSTFGSFNAGTNAASPFGGFKPAASTSAFGAPPAFGAATSTQPATGGGLFGSSNTSGGLFGNTSAPAPAPAFGGGFGFGASTSSAGLFGSNTSSGLFGNTQNSSFGAKPAGFGFGSTPAPGTSTGGLFGAAPTPSTGLFGQPSNNMSGGGLFSNTSATTFGATAVSGTAHVKYSPVVGTDVVVKSGTSQNINIKHHCITCMKEYESKSLEELRLEDYTAGRKGAPAAMFGGGFGQHTENKPLFGASTFGQPATTSSSVFGAPTLSSGGFGQSNSFSFGSNTQPSTNTTGLFASKPPFATTSTSGTGLFGAASTQAPTFGTNTSSFGFGSTTPSQSTNMFGAKPGVSSFGTSTGTSFGSFGTTGGLFQPKPAQPAPIQPTQGFGSLPGAFGSTAPSTGVFGSTFGKPAAAPAFGFSTQPTLGTGLGAVGSLGTQAKPATGAFGAVGSGSLFQPPQQTSLLPQTGMNNSMFGGSLGAPSLGTGLNLSNTTFNSTNVGAGVHEQMLSLAARPYGDSPLFKDLLPDTSCSPLAARATNPAAAAPPPPPARRPLRLQPRPLPNDKKSLFDGLEESDATLEDKLCLKPSRKRLVLRNDGHQDSHANRSLEESSKPVNGSEQPDRTDGAVEEQRQHTNFNDNTEVSTDKNNSWLTSKVPWNDKEKPIDNESTPRLYPNIDKEVRSQSAERRASWLTTKPLSKPMSNAANVENSVRELGVRSPEPQSADKENIDNLSVSEDENVAPKEMPPHPTGVKLTRPGYYTIPSLDEMIKFMRADGTCVVPHLTVGRHNYGNVYYDCEIDVAGMDLDSLVHFLNKEVVVYPEEEVRPPQGCGLNRRALVTLDRVWPRDKTCRKLITDPDRLLKMDYESKLRRVCDKHDTKFIEYRPQTGSWVFRVEHFSKYGLTDSDEEDDAPEVLKRQIAQAALQKAAPVLAAKPVPSPGLGGLGLLSGPGAPEDSLFAMHQTSLNLLNGASKAFEMDTTEDNTEAQSLYQDQRDVSERAHGVKSPTSELARLERRQTQHVQLMKASLYADAEMEDDVSVSTGDQLVPISCPLVATILPTAREEDHSMEQDTAVEVASEVALQPLLVQPHTIVLQYHRKVPPFRETVAGGLGADCLADWRVSRARHFRVGFGPQHTLAIAATSAAITALPNSAELFDLNQYVAGRSQDDWSEQVIARIALANGDSTGQQEEFLTRHMETLLEWSAPVPVASGPLPRREASDRKALLAAHLLQCEKAKPLEGRGQYFKQVWRLCDALWGADLDNDGTPGTDDASIVDRHRRLLGWLTDAVADTTDRELARPAEGEGEDEEDGHSSRVWALMVGGRRLEACRLAREHDDLYMATLLAQASGDPAFRSLLSRQLSLWRECGAATLMASHRYETLRLIAGEAAPLGKLVDLDWLRAFHATARYLCSQVPSLERIVQTYEGLFPSSEDGRPSFGDADSMDMKVPLPDYMDTFQITENGKRHLVLDLRYELIAARAAQRRPKLTPASHTPDPLDHSLCFFLGAWFGAPSEASVAGFAEQLEACGSWHLAVAALLYHPNDGQRAHLVRSVIGRHAPAKAPPSCGKMALLRRLRVPEHWIREAQAHRAKYQHLPALEAEHLVAAGQYNSAHTVLMEELLPDAVLADDLKSIAPLLESLHEAAGRHEVSGWDSGGLALYHYLHVCDEVRALVSSSSGASGALGARLEALRPAVSAASNALRALQPKSSRHAAARTEMGGRLVQLCVAGGVGGGNLAALLRSLKLPPGTIAPALRQLTSELAEAASESCAESTASSPRSRLIHT